MPESRQLLKEPPLDIPFTIHIKSYFPFTVASHLKVIKGQGHRKEKVYDLLICHVGALSEVEDILERNIGLSFTIPEKFYFNKMKFDVSSKAYLVYQLLKK